MKLPKNWPDSQEGKDAELFFKELKLSGVDVKVDGFGYCVVCCTERRYSLDLCWDGKSWYLIDDGAHRHYFGDRKTLVGRRRRYKIWRTVQNNFHRFLDDPDEFYERIMRRWSFGEIEEDCDQTNA